MSYRPQPRHADKVRTRDDCRAQLAQYLVFVSPAIFATVTVDLLAQRYPKLPVAELARELATAQARRSARG